MKDKDGAQGQELDIETDDSYMDEELIDDDVNSGDEPELSDDEDDDSADDPVEDKRLKTAIAQKRRYREKSERLEKELQELKQEKKVKEEPKKEVKTEKPELSHEDYTDIKLEHPYLQREDIEKAAHWANVEGITVQEVLKQPFFKTYAQEKYKEDISKAAMPSPSGRAGSAGSATLRRLADNPEEFHKLSKSQKEKVRKLLSNK